MVLLMAFLAKVHVDPLNKDWEEKTNWWIGLTSFGNGSRASKVEFRIWF